MSRVDYLGLDGLDSLLRDECRESSILPVVYVYLSVFLSMNAQTINLLLVATEL